MTDPGRLAQLAVTLFTGERSNRSTLSRAGWVAPTGPLAKPLSTLSVTLRTNRADAVVEQHVAAVAIAQSQRSVPAVKTPAPDLAV